MPTLQAPGLRLGAQTATSVSLAWTDPNVNDKGTEVQRRIDTGLFLTLVKPGKGVQTWTDTRLPVASNSPVTVTYRMRAWSSHNAISPWSNDVATIITPAQVPPPTTAPTPLLSATFNCIGWRATCPSGVSGSTTIQPYYKPTSSGTWRALGIGYETLATMTAGVSTCLIDLRATIDTISNPYYNEARGSIVGLTENTSYDFYVAWSTGATSPVVSTTTLNSTVPYGGSTLTVTNDATLDTALSSAVPGDTIHLNAGTYKAFTWTKSGTANAWIKIEGPGTFAGTGSSYSSNGNLSLVVSGNYVDVNGLGTITADLSGIQATGTNVFVRNCTVNFGNAATEANYVPDDGPHYNDAGIITNSSTYVLSNTVTWLGTNANHSFHGPGTGIVMFNNADTVVIKGNTVSGLMRDAISSDDSANFTSNCDIAENTASGYADDGIESKGGNLNVRVWGNRAIEDQGNTCYAFNTNAVGGHTSNLYGPLYVFRNVAITTGSLGTETWKLNSTVPLFLFHNSTDSSTAGAAYDCLAGGGFLLSAGALLSRMITRNNAYKIRGQYTYFGGEYNSHDYDCAIRTNTSTYAGSWILTNFTTVTYDTWADFTTSALDTYLGGGAKQEAHGLQADPTYVTAGSDLHLQAGSPAIDKGVVIPNFNDADSAWPFLGTAPDCGAFEKS